MSFFGNLTALRAYSKHIKGKNEEALALYRKAEQKAPITETTCILSYAALLMRESELEKARELLVPLARDTAVPQGQRDTARIHLALIRWRLGDPEKAIEILESMMERGENTILYQTLGCLYTDCGMLEKAYEFNKKGVEYDDADSVILDNMGQTLYKMAMKERENGCDDKAAELLKEAEPYFDKALERRSNQTDSWYYKAVLLLERGEKDEAAEAIESGLKCHFSMMNTVSREMFEKLKTEL